MVLVLTCLSVVLSGSTGHLVPHYRLKQAVPQDIAKLQAEAEAGSALAQLNLAKAYEDGDGVPKDEERAFEWFRKSAEQGNPEAQNRLGEMYRGGDVVQQDKATAVSWWHAAARQGNASAMCHLGVAYYNGDGVGVDDSQSYAWFLLAKRAGCQDANEAVRRAESQLHTWAIEQAWKEIAEMYDRGDVLPKNPAEAARWWLDAAKKGDLDAQMTIATKFLNGDGVPQDFEQGRHWCDEAVKKDDRRGRYCLGFIYQKGLGVPRDLSRARKEYAAAASAGGRPYVMPMKALAEMEAKGEGGKVDHVAACILYARLVSAGDKDALRYLTQLRSQMDQQEWKKVEKQLPLVGIDVRKLDSALQQSTPSVN
jgi:TPR repeat protein